jgi:molecular chaperone GrpE (heat shock protein)
LQKTEKALTESTEAAADFAAGNELEQLRFMNNNYRNSLELVQAMLDELNETIDETAADAKKAAIASFYSTMNSAEYGNLLDSLELVDRRLAALKEQKIPVPPQLLPLTIVFKQLLRFIKDCGISPIDTTGREFVTEAEGLAEYTYVGDAYSEEGEKKTVVVERPGWKFEDTVISLPTVREKEE